jgi:hypothetical protein
MDNPADTLDQADEDILTPTISDDALEGAAVGIRAYDQTQATADITVWCCYTSRVDYPRPFRGSEPHK